MRAPASRVRPLVFALGLLILLGAVVPVPTSDAGEPVSWGDWRALEKRFKAACDDPARYDEALSCAAEIVKDAEPRALKALLAAVTHAIAREEKAAERSQKLAQGILKGRWSREIHAELSAVRREADWAHRLGEGIADRVGEGEPALHDGFAAAAAKTRDKRWHGLAARIYAHTPERSEAIEWLYQASVDENPDVRARVLLGVAPYAKDWPELVGQRVADRSWAIQTIAARLAKQHRIQAAIGAMIGQLSCAPPRVQLQFAQSLEALTGNDGWGVDPKRWSFWWQQNRGRFGPQTSMAGGSVCPPRDYAKFYDLVIKSDRLLLVVDVSDSMRQHAIQSYAQDGAPIRGQYRRIDLVKRQLHRTIDELPRGVKFNILTFGDEVRAWNKDLVDMDAKQRRRAHAWVERLQPDGGTRMNGAFHAVFGSLRFADCTRGPLKADTIVLLSDGAPTDGWPGGRGTKGRAVVLEALREWNRNGLLVIHTVALRGAAEAFLAALAEQNGGHATVR
ncbi:MAG: VWA domain-containing protein [Planctomycetota bacterium]|nr:VWA domain-containing protein [Planctomycetota bacterium]